MNDDERITLKEAARAIHRRYGYVRKLVDEGHVPAWEKGGEERKRLVVRLEDVKAAEDRVTRYVPPKRKTSHRRTGSLDSMVKC